MVARIYRPARTAMQSGKRNTTFWRLEFEQEVPQTIDPLMGYTSSRDTRRQVSIRFATLEEAVAYAKRNNIAYRVIEPQEPKRRKVAYADNFRSDRRIPWTH